MRAAFQSRGQRGGAARHGAATLPPPPPPPRRRRRKPCSTSAATGNSDGFPQPLADSEELLLRAQQLTARRAALDAEEAQLAEQLQRQPSEGEQSPPPKQQPVASTAEPEWMVGLPDELQATLRESGLVASLQEKAAALRADTEWGTSEIYGGGDLEAVARLIEEGGALPPIPDEEWGEEAEPGEELKARWHGVMDYTFSPLKGSKHYSGPPPGSGSPQEAAAAAAAAAHTSRPQVVLRALRYSLEPALAAAFARGWEQGREWDRRWDAGEVGRYYEIPPEPSKSIPFPEVPSDVEAVFKAAERLAYVLRRAHLESDAPDAPLLALQRRGLLSDAFLLGDPFVECEGCEEAAEYLGRLRAAGATLELSTIMLKCDQYKPEMRWTATIDCFLNLPYPPWVHTWAELNQGTAAAAVANPSWGSSPASSPGSDSVEGGSAAAAARSPPPGGRLDPVSAAAIAAAEAAAAAEEQRQNAADLALVEGMLAAAVEAAEAAGTTLDGKGKAGVMRAAAGIALRRREEQQAAAEAAATAAVQAASAADARQAETEAARRQQRGAGAAAAAGAPSQQSEPLPLPELLAVHSEPYAHEGERRQHRWVLMDFEQQHRQMGRQAFEVYPRRDITPLEASAAALAAVPPEQRAAARARQLQLLPVAGIEAGDWGAEEEGQRVRQQPQQQQQQQQQGAAEPPPPRQQQEEAVEELFPFTLDWERQRRRREAGAVLRTLLGDKFDSVMGQLPRMGRTRGRNSNAALDQEEEREGTAWLGGECLTVNATWSWTMDAATRTVAACTLTWGAVHGLHMREVADAFDIWLEASGLLVEAEAEADEELGLAPRPAGAPPGSGSWIPRWRIPREG